MSIGTHQVAVVGDLERGIRLSRGAYARATVRPDDVVSVPVDYRAEATAHGAGSQVFSGWVVAAEPGKAAIALEMDNGLQLEETKFIHFSHAGMTAPELFWSMARLARFPPDALRVSGLNPKRDRISSRCR